MDNDNTPEWKIWLAAAGFITFFIVLLFLAAVFATY